MEIFMISARSRCAKLYALLLSSTFFLIQTTDGRIGDLSKDVFIQQNFSFTYINPGPYLQLFVSKASTSTQERLVLQPSLS